MRNVRWIPLVAVGLALAACGSSGSNQSANNTAAPTTTANAPTTTAATTTEAPTTTSAPSTTPPPTTAARTGLTYSAYNMLMTGMTEAEVTAITGPCETTSQSQIGGVTGKILDCKGEGAFSGATLIFSDGKLVSKSQFGLNGASTEVKGSMTLAKFDQLQVGQTADEVQAITGPCERSSETSIAGIESFALTCYASDGLGNAFLLFTDNKLTTKSHFGLS